MGVELEVSAAQIDKVIQSVSDTTPGNIPVKGDDGGVEDSNVTQDPTGEIRASTEIKAEDGLDTIQGTITLGDSLDVGSSGGQQVNFSRVTGKRYQMPYQEIDKTGTKKVFHVDVDGEIVNDPRQAVFDTTMVSPLVFNYLSPRDEVVNKVYLRTSGDVTNFRYQVKSLDTGQVIDSYPDKFKYEKGEGVDFIGAGVHEVDLYFVGSSTPNRYLNGQNIEVTMEWDAGSFLGNVSNVPYFAYDYQKFYFIFTNPYPDEDKWRDRVSSYLSTDLTLTGAEQVLAFDVDKWSRHITNTAGVFTIPETGYYNGSINLNVSVIGISSFIIWVECKPFEGAWGLCGESMIKISGGDDFSGNVPMNSGFDFVEGDEVRIMAKKLSGTVALISATAIVANGTLVEPSASITFMRVDNIIT